MSCRQKDKQKADDTTSKLICEVKKRFSDKDVSYTSLSSILLHVQCKYIRDQIDDFDKHRETHFKFTEEYRVDIQCNSGGSWLCTKCVYKTTR